MNYNEAYSKIIDAYFKDEIKPFRADFCFCGTLHGDSSWRFSSAKGEYTIEEFGKMELALFSPMKNVRYIRIGRVFPNSNPCGKIEYTEDELFAGMSAALDVLREIHESRGEIIDQPQPFTKRELKTV